MALMALRGGTRASFSKPRFAGPPRSSGVWKGGCGDARSSGGRRGTGGGASHVGARGPAERGPTAAPCAALAQRHLQRPGDWIRGTPHIRDDWAGTFAICDPRAALLASGLLAPSASRASVGMRRPPRPSVLGPGAGTQSRRRGPPAGRGHLAGGSDLPEISPGPSAAATEKGRGPPCLPLARRGDSNIYLSCGVWHRCRRRHLEGPRTAPWTLRKELGGGGAQGAFPGRTPSAEAP